MPPKNTGGFNPGRDRSIEAVAKIPERLRQSSSSSAVNASVIGF
jgi:hypothetical protein